MTEDPEHQYHRNGGKAWGRWSGREKLPTGEKTQVREQELESLQWWIKGIVSTHICHSWKHPLALQHLPPCSSIYSFISSFNEYLPCAYSTQAQGFEAQGV